VVLSESQWDKLDTVSRFLLSFLVIVFCVVALGTFSEIQSFESDLESSSCFLRGDNVSGNVFYNESLDLPMPRQGEDRYSLNGVD
jgi:hypothetical protein